MRSCRWEAVETVVAYYREQIAASQKIVGSFDLDAPCAWPEMAHQNLRWVALHMIEETARHAAPPTSSARPSAAAADSDAADSVSADLLARHSSTSGRGSGNQAGGESRPRVSGQTLRVLNLWSRGGTRVRLRVRATMLMLVAGACAGVIMGGPRSVVVPVAAHAGSVQLAAYRPEGAFSGPDVVATQARSSPCTGCTAIRLKLAALTLLAGVTLFVGGFVLLGRRRESNRGETDAGKVRDG
jgi:Protein of unknown function (DUF664)